MASSDQPTTQQLEQLERQLILLKHKQLTINKGVADTETAIAELKSRLGKVSTIPSAGINQA